MITFLSCFVANTGCDRGVPLRSGSSNSTNSAEVQPASSLDVATGALARGDLVAARSAIEQHLLAQPTDSTGLEIAGDIASASAGAEQAIQLYRSAIEQSSGPSAALYEKLGRQYMIAGSPYEAAEVLRTSVGAHPNNAKVRADYAGLTASLGMVRDAVEHLRWLLRRGRGGLNELIMLADLTVPQADQSICQYALEHRPDDLRPRFPLASVAADEGDWQRAASELAQVIEKHPDFSVAWAHYGRALVETEEDDQLQAWRDQLPVGTDQWAAYWVAAGTWAEKNNQPELASRAFAEAVRIDDCHGEALTHLAANLAQLGRQSDAERVAGRSAEVNAMHDSVESLFSWRRNSQKAALEIAAAMNRLGRPWEAEAWARASLAMTQELDERARETHRQLHAKLASTTPWQLPELSVLNLVDLSDLDEFRWSASDSVMPVAPSFETVASSIRFADEASARGLVHTCAIDKSQPEASIWIYQSNAGGAGVIDYDHDGWPDIYLTVMDGHPLQNDSAPNRLLRNQAGTFSDATSSAGLDERGFSQGIAAGDYNADGFCDLLVANIGINRLYRNNGDGTFRDVTEDIGLEGVTWTTSVAMADIDNDGHTDLFEVNYSAGESPYSQLCIDNEVGQPRSCSPLVFQAERDGVWRGLGDGTFVNASELWMSGQVAGHGLGLVVGQFDQQPGVDVYVANDMTANQFWSSSVRDDQFTLSEQAAVRGLAVNSRSKSQASMGIAVGDADLDGDMDLFLTHFTDDHNTLYEQIKPGVWFDRTSSLGLAQPSMKMLAFGTEWIDADNNGSLELLVANGNVDDFSHQGHPLRMPPQLFLRNAQGRWQEADRDQLGPYFQRRVVGRALVTLDLNRDGLKDAIVTHLYDPVSALVNRSMTQSKSIRLFLKGRESSRDAIGTIVTASVGNENRVMQLTAGDGFQCSNERCITLGLGSAESAEKVTIVWPAGGTHSVASLPGGHDYLIIEGTDATFDLGEHAR